MQSFSFEKVAPPELAEAADGSIDLIKAHRAVERIPRADILPTLKSWVAKLAPGGRLVIECYDFEWLAKEYLAGKPINVQAAVMCDDGGSQAIMDRELLVELMANAGVERIAEHEKKDGWLALTGYKPSAPTARLDRTIGVLSCPRHGPIFHFRNANTAMFGIPYEIHQGAYWHQIISEAIESVIAKGPEFVLTLDFDTAMHRADVLELHRLMDAYPEADAIVPLQSRRGGGLPMFGLVGPDGKPKNQAFLEDFDRNMVRIASGHFGLTLFRAEKFAKMPKPWMLGIPDGNGRWTTGGDGVSGKTDPDIQFWQQWTACGNTVYLAPRVVIGHIEEKVAVPGRDFKPVYLDTSEYFERGIPKECVR